MRTVPQHRWAGGCKGAKFTVNLQKPSRRQDAKVMFDAEMEALFGSDYEQLELDIAMDKSEIPVGTKAAKKGPRQRPRKAAKELKAAPKAEA
jgi:hypothetical protein